jgi:LacI family transcriptional regulator
MLGNSDFDLKMEKKLFNTLKAKNVDGLLFVGSGGRTPFIDNLENRKKIVFVDRIYENIEKNYVIVDNIKGMNDLVNYLLDLNHKSFVMINGKKRTYTAEKRREGFELALKNANISQYEIIYSGYSYEKGYETALSLKEIPDAVVCGDDMIAFGVIDALKKRGINVPEDVSVTGFDDLTFSSKFSPPLTTMHQPIYELGFEAAKLLVKIINDKQIKKNKIILPTTLVPRKTTALRLKKTS